MELRFAIPIWLGLGLRVSVSAGEAAVVQKLNNPDRLLAPVGEGFGADKRKSS